MRRINVQGKKNLLLACYLGAELRSLTVEYFNLLARCYMDVFNEQEGRWGENWTLESAHEEIQSSLSFNDHHRVPVACFLEEDGAPIGFAWGILTDCCHLNSETDMPFQLNPDKKKAGLEAVKYWMSAIKKEKVLLFREIAIQRGRRGSKLIPFLAQHILTSALAQDCLFVVYWTNQSSPVLFLGTGIGWHPIHLYPQEKFIIMGGSVRESLATVQGCTSGDLTLGWRLIEKRVKRLLCE